MTEKSPEVEKLLEALSPYGRSGQVCATCGSEKVDQSAFRDPISFREFEISRMCQVCQDRIFGADDDE